ncbi:MAG: FAD-binding protein [Desulfobacteraceae bacterium]|nr:MAG: FAD-binding protein [Desulfobacteraceae bacterium]
MKIKINQLNLPLDYEEKDILNAAAEKIKCSASLISSLKIIRRSIDARKSHESPFFSIHVELEIPETAALMLPHDKDIQVIPEEKIFPEIKVPKISGKTANRPVVVGSGPSGLMAALALAEAGLSPILIERGFPVRERASQVSLFWKKGELNPEGNVLFGEGGAGLFSDGKLTTRSKDRFRVRRFLETLVKCGAPEDILINAEPHLGSDLLKKIVPAFRNLIEEKGGKVQFHSKFEGIHVDKNRLRGVIVNGEEMETDNCILATGHSARDVYVTLAESGVMLEQKSFAAGLRLELPQERINRAQWRNFAGHPRLGAAGFRMTFKETDKSRACYTFCMCPGGTVIPCASSNGCLTTNGMSLSARSGKFGNAAFLVPVNPADFGNEPGAKHPGLSGISFQNKIERLAYDAGGGDYSLPATSLSGFLKNKYTGKLLEERSWPRSRPADLHMILPDFVTSTLTAAIPGMLKNLKGVPNEEVLLYAAETRSSSPIRILRDENGESVNVSGLFPAGEGSGYAGGIVSSAVDGLRAAEAVINKATIRSLR